MVKLVEYQLSVCDKTREYQFTGFHTRVVNESDENVSIDFVFCYPFSIHVLARFVLPG